MAKNTCILSAIYIRSVSCHEASTDKFVENLILYCSFLSAFLFFDSILIKILLGAPFGI